ncbi:WD40-repeat-containing domain protein [Gongronella butleri]|nr:WD40-repeat-containing domain protein [Gongronella butleri]
MRKQGKGLGLSSSFASNTSASVGSNTSSAQGRMQRMVTQAGLVSTRLSSESQRSRHGSIASTNDVVNVFAGPMSSLRTRLSGAITSLALSPGGDAVVVAGREILKILTVSPEEVTETLNLRAGSQSTLNFSSNDVKWGNNATKAKIATAATNGAIVIWDIYRVGRKAERFINEHSRAVNRICFQPENGHMLLSASQDGTMRCWDLRDPRAGAKFRFEGKSESVRDVQFNPIAHYEFAAAFETGTLQKWDMRNPKAIYDRKVSAHNGPCLTVDWHPTGRLVATGGRDKTIKVWDLNTDRRPLYTMRTMASVARVQWRPGSDDEIASCALLTEKRIHVWDVRRPHIPKYAFDEHESSPTGFLWYNDDVMYSVAKDKFFVRQHIQGAYQPVDLLKHNSLCWNIQGDLALAVDNFDHSEFVDSRTTKSSLTSVIKKGKRTTTKVTSLEDTVQYVPQQTCAIGHLPLFDYETFTVFAENYIIADDNLAYACEMNSQLAWKLGHYRTAQTWRIVSVLFQDANPHKDTLHDDHVLANMLAKDLLRDTDEDAENEEGDEQSTRATPPANESDDSVNDAKEGQKLSRKDLWPTWKHDTMVDELLDFYMEQGDVQTCVTLYLVLRRYITVDEHRVEEWFTAYLDILRRLKLWTAANAIIKASDIPRIQEQNQLATTIHVACNNCFKLVAGTTNGAWACDKCRKLLNPCSVCHQTVKSLYVWCQGCNHGGHMGHMRDWFSSEKECPTGCGHQCVL